jgi:hypothetical protein
MKILLWIYAVCGSLYFLLYSSGAEHVVKYAKGPLWLMMMASPVVLTFLIVAQLFFRKR